MLPPNVAEYLIAQHIPDLFRRETRNVGVFVRMAGRIEARFLGEKDGGGIDGRLARTMVAPDVYEMWVRYWRNALATKGEKAWEAIIDTARDHYRLIEGGTVDGVGADTAADVAQNLFTALVSPGGMSAALGFIDDSEAAARLADDVEDAFRNLNILDRGNPNMFMRAKHPVVRDKPVKGKRTTHTLSFVQQGDRMTVMEPIDLGVRRDRRRVEERAGWASRVFEDILAEDKTAQTVAIVSVPPEQEDDRTVKYARSLLRGVAETVDWRDPGVRSAFIAERAKLAAAG